MDITALYFNSMDGCFTYTLIDRLTILGPFLGARAFPISAGAHELGISKILRLYYGTLIQMI